MKFWNFLNVSDDCCKKILMNIFILFLTFMQYSKCDYNYTRLKVITLRFVSSAHSFPFSLFLFFLSFSFYIYSISLSFVTLWAASCSIRSVVQVFVYVQETNSKVKVIMYFHRLNEGDILLLSFTEIFMYNTICTWGATSLILKWIKCDTRQVS